MVGVYGAETKGVARVNVKASTTQAGRDIDDLVFGKALSQGFDFARTVGDHYQGVVVFAREAVVSGHGLVNATPGVGKLDGEGRAVHAARRIDSGHRIFGPVEERACDGGVWPRQIAKVVNCDGLPRQSGHIGQCFFGCGEIEGPADLEEVGVLDMVIGLILQGLQVVVVKDGRIGIRIAILFIGQL